MTKHTFLNTLERRLSALPKAEREEYILYYEELINDRMEEGCSEQEAVAQLEEIDLIVGRILGERSDLSAGSTPPPAVPKSRGCLKAFLIGCAALVLLALILSFAGVAAIGIVFDRLEGRNTPMGGELRLEEEKTASSVDSGETVVGAQPESSLSLPTEIPSGVEHLLGEVSADRLRSIDIDWTADAVHIEPYDGETVRVAEWSDEVLDESHHGRMTMEGAEMEIDFSIRENVRGIPSKRLIVQLPREFYLDSLSVDSASAEVMVTGVTGREAEIDTASGSVWAEGIWKAIDVDTAS
ncbi:MAG: DUF1700 domain-containing protein, partial [Clostridia bacterium]|nr:DUF1700 domain-containing protein [Clostridia bacterium]